MNANERAPKRHTLGVVHIFRSHHNWLDLVYGAAQAYDPIPKTIPEHTFCPNDAYADFYDWAKLSADTQTGLAIALPADINNDGNLAKRKAALIHGAQTNLGTKRPEFEKAK